MTHRIFLLFFVLLIPSILFSQTESLDSLEIIPLNQKISSNTLYKISFISKVEIPKDAQFVINFPDGFDLSKVNLAGSNSIDGGFEVVVNNQQITIKRRGEGQTIEPGKRANVMFSVVKNPGNINTDYPIEFQILNSEQTALSNKEIFSVSFAQ